MKTTIRGLLGLAGAAALVSLTGIALAAPSTRQVFAGREVVLHVPDRLPPSGQRALVIVLHGGLGNADRIAGGGDGGAGSRLGAAQSESAMNLDAEADRNGFIVAYLNGTPVARRLGDRFRGWNAGGGCCGVPAETGVDDVAYVTSFVRDMTGRYGVDAAKVYGLGHSNGAMMLQRVACETPALAAVVAVSGPLNLDAGRCPGAKGRQILALHGADDRNVPLDGGVGAQGLSRLAFRSEASRAAP